MSEAIENNTFGKYQIIDRIASGGMAEIYKARMEGLGGFQRLFALKRILPEYSENKDFIEMLVEEAKIAGLLSHANIVQIVDLGQIDGSYYIAMEYVDGPNLGQLIQRLSNRKCAEIGVGARNRLARRRGLTGEHLCGLRCQDLI